ncbi:MAG: reverse transcriptase family protein [Candidatus Competibacterales bacterium]
MADRPTTRQALYDRIRASSKEEVILEEMIRLGFWTPEDQVAQDRAEGQEGAVDPGRRRALEGELRALIGEQSRLQNFEAMRRELRQRRLEASRRQQQQTRERRERERVERAEAWRERKTRELLFLGEGVSTNLNALASHHPRLEAQGLPLFDTPLELAEAMGLDLGELRFLAHHRPVAKVHHYVQFKIPKRSGGERLISAPMPRLKACQRWIATRLLEYLPVHDAAHGFRPGRSIVTNAQPHVGAAVVVNADFRDFFPTVNYRRVWGVFRQLGYAPSVATALALLCTEAEVEAVELDGQRYFVATGERRLPQGSPASPPLSNLVCHRLDRRLAGVATQLGYRYTRYADDLTFSRVADAQGLGQLLARVRWVSAAEGFQLHPDKVRVMRSHQRQEVTGLTVNGRLGVARTLLKRFRATLHQVERDGPAGKRWGASGDVLSALAGFANFVAMVDPAKGLALRQRVKALQGRHSKGAGDGAVAR